MTPMKTTFMTTILFALVTSVANAQIRPGPAPQQREVTRTVNVNRPVLNGEFSVRRLANLGEQFRQYDLKNVTVELKATPITMVELLVDGRVEASARASGNSIVLRAPGDRNIGRSMDSIIVRLRGPALVERITVTIREGRQQPPERQIQVEVPLNIQTRNNDRINLGRHVDLSRYQGWKVQAVRVKAGSDRAQNAVVDLLINGAVTDSAVFGRAVDEKGLKGNDRVIGRGADSIVLRTRGEMTVKKATLKLER